MGNNLFASNRQTPKQIKLLIKIKKRMEEGKPGEGEEEEGAKIKKVSSNTSHNSNK